MDAHTLTPTAMSAASTQTDLHEHFEAGQLRGAVRLSRLERAGVRASLSPANTEGIAPEDQHGQHGEHRTSRDNGERGGRSSMGLLIANTSGFTIASATPIVSTGSPLDFRSNHTCARVADEVGHGNRNRLTSHSGNPPASPLLGHGRGASPWRWRATPATVTPNDARPITTISA